MSLSPPTPPDGYQPLSATGLLVSVGAVFCRSDETAGQEETHLWCHPETGVSEGGLMLELARSALEVHGRFMTTSEVGELLSLSCDFTSAGGDAPELTPNVSLVALARVIRATRSILFLEATVHHAVPPDVNPDSKDASPLLMASALWRRG
ncbi:MAG: hypothetical protein V6Z81_05210 [Parvularculales bacterium]